MVLRRDSSSNRRAGSGAVVFDRDGYRNWRAQELRSQFNDYFSQNDIADKDVVDFGCGEGDLSFLMADMGVRSITGLEISPDRVASAERRSNGCPFLVRPRFLVAKNPDAVELATGSVDVILCFDVLEHVMEYEKIIREWHRILRDRGRVLIWWVPWWHPYGPHIESLVPIPWAHVIFSEEILIETCSRVYDMPGFKPRIWDLDEQGVKKPNKWVACNRLPEVNKLTMKGFETICANVGFRIASKKIRGFGSSMIAKFTHMFLKIPSLAEYFTSSVVYVLEKRGMTAELLGRDECHLPR
jgi:SAM-dependent methyltransferase